MHQKVSLRCWLSGIVLLAAVFAQIEASGQPGDFFFPTDAGVINVKDFGAVGDGVTDDTAAINAVLGAYNASTAQGNLRPWTIYFPEGEYLVSDTLAATAPGFDHPLNGVRMVGQNRDDTVIRLSNNADGFGNANDPKFIVRTGNIGGQGNSGYSNYVQNLTINTGQGNPGAGGVHYDVANIGAIQDVRIVSGAANGRGSYGLGVFGTSGQGYVKRVEIEGFDRGVHVEGSVNNIVFEDIGLTDQRDTAIYNEAKVLSFHGLTTRGNAPILKTDRSLATTYLLDVDAQGAGGAAFDMRVPSYVYLRDANISGYDTGVDIGQGGAGFDIPTGSVDEWWSHGGTVGEADRSLRLEVRDTPEFYPHANTNWVNVTDFGANPDDGTNDAPAVQQALNFAAQQGGDTVVYFPYGTYTLNDDVVVRDGVRMVDFMHSEIDSDNGRARFFVRQSEGEIA
ncbi:MAG: glycosyl hydrolase family 28-related protein, partial [Planctomycetota bacterium]